MQLREAQALYRQLLLADRLCRPITTYLLGDGGYGVTVSVDGQPTTVVDAKWGDAMCALIERSNKAHGYK